MNFQIVISHKGLVFVSAEAEEGKDISETGGF